MQHRLAFWFPRDSCCLRPLSERLRCFGCTLMYDLRGALSNMRAVRLCQLLKDITINRIFSTRSATVQREPVKDRMLEGRLQRRHRASRLREGMAVLQHQQSGAVSPRKRVHTILIKFTHFYVLDFIFSFVQSVTLP